MSVCFYRLKSAKVIKMHASLSCLSVYIILYEKKRANEKFTSMHVENCLCLICSMPFSFRKTDNQLAAREQKEQNFMTTTTITTAAIHWHFLNRDEEEKTQCIYAPTFCDYTFDTKFYCTNFDDLSNKIIITGICWLARIEIAHR